MPHKILQHSAAMLPHDALLPLRDSFFLSHRHLWYIKKKAAWKRAHSTAGNTNQPDMYRPIADYGIIGNMQTAALVSNDGSIDYCSMPFLDSPTIFASLLDDEKGGFFSIQPLEKFTAEQEYVPDTNVLACTFRTTGSVAVLFDFMPAESQQLPDRKEHRIHRCLLAESGPSDFVLRFAPRPDYATALPAITISEKALTAVAGANHLVLVHSLRSFTIIEQKQDSVTLSFRLDAGEKAHFNLIYGNDAADNTIQCNLQETIDYWREWLRGCFGGNCALKGRYTPMINRSMLTLKLLTFHPTGAIAAAATTSLPETIGGERNWDYRFTWLRDASFTLKAFFSLGHIAEADRFIRWLHNTYRHYGSTTLNIMYSLQGEKILTEKTLDHLGGYKNSAPVRIGNLAHNQDQWDIYGEVMDAALRLSDYAGRIDEDLWPFFCEICRLAMQNWNKPDDGIWEVRNGPAHFVYSKIMCWVALDRGITIAKRFGFEAPLEEWIAVRQAIRQDILEKGYNTDMGSFVQRYGSEDLDASLLLMPLTGFLPVQDSRIQSTIRACRHHLISDGFLLRYRSADGLKGEEGGFILCNFWLIECLALSGDVDGAKEILANTLRASNRLGLFSEEYDGQSGTMLGNFPQAFSHIGLINAVYAIVNAENHTLEAAKDPSLIERLYRLIPFRAILNESPSETDAGNDEELSARLKQLLGRLQGAYFDNRKGRVDYLAIKRSSRFAEYRDLASHLRSFDLSTLDTDDRKKAFWINMYNILIIHGVIEFDIQHSVLDIANFFGRIGYRIGGRDFTPDDIEHGILRRNKPHPVIPLPQFSLFDERKQFMLKQFDPRIHFALVCASSSCPPIEFYDYRHIDRQLDVAARSFINRSGLEILKSTMTIRLSRIFQWYEKDFGSSRKEMLLYAASFASEENERWIREHAETLKISYIPYNWNLNSTLE